MMFTSANPKGYSGWLARILGILLALSLLASTMPALAAPTAKIDWEDCWYTYEVKRGDNLRSISNKFGINVGSIVDETEMDPPYTIYVGQRLCIPKKNIKNAPNVSTSRRNAYAVYFTAGRSGNDILVYTYNYPKTTVLVKGENAGNSSWKLVDIGKINIAAAGNRKVWRFRLPSELRVKKLLICLKDRRTGYLQCVSPRSGG
jgi:LysM repeat protein